MSNAGHWREPVQKRRRPMATPSLSSGDPSLATRSVPKRRQLQRLRSAAAAAVDTRQLDTGSGETVLSGSQCRSPGQSDQLVIAPAPAEAAQCAAKMESVLRSLHERRRSGPGRRRRLSTVAQLKQAQQGIIDLHTADSVLTRVQVRQLLTCSNFSRLPSLYQLRLGSLLPDSDTTSDSDGNMRLSGGSLQNEFVARSCLQWQERLARGEFASDHSSKLRSDLESRRRRLDPWKARNFEPVWGKCPPARSASPVSRAALSALSRPLPDLTDTVSEGGRRCSWLPCVPRAAAAAVPPTTPPRVTSTEMELCAAEVDEHVSMSVSSDSSVASSASAASSAPCSQSSRVPSRRSAEPSSPPHSPSSCPSDDAAANVEDGVVDADDAVAANDDDDDVVCRDSADHPATDRAVYPSRADTDALPLLSTSPSVCPTATAAAASATVTTAAVYSDQSAVSTVPCSQPPPALDGTRSSGATLAVSDCGATPAVSDCGATPVVSNCGATPAVSDCGATPAVSDCGATLAVSDCGAALADSDCDAELTSQLVAESSVALAAPLESTRLSGSGADEQSPPHTVSHRSVPDASASVSQIELSLELDHSALLPVVTTALQLSPRHCASSAAASVTGIDLSDELGSRCSALSVCASSGSDVSGCDVSGYDVSGYDTELPPDHAPSALFSRSVFDCVSQAADRPSPLPTPPLASSPCAAAATGGEATGTMRQESGGPTPCVTDAIMWQRVGGVQAGTGDSSSVSSEDHSSSVLECSVQTEDERTVCHSAGSSRYPALTDSALPSPLSPELVTSPPVLVPPTATDAFVPQQTPVYRPSPSLSPVLSAAVGVPSGSVLRPSVVGPPPHRSSSALLLPRATHLVCPLPPRLAAPAPAPPSGVVRAPRLRPRAQGGRGARHSRPVTGSVNLERSYQICQAVIAKSQNRDRLQAQMKPLPRLLAENSASSGGHSSCPAAAAAGVSAPPAAAAVSSHQLLLTQHYTATNNNTNSTVNNNNSAVNNNNNSSAVNNNSGAGSSHTAPLHLRYLQVGGQKVVASARVVSLATPPPPVHPASSPAPSSSAALRRVSADSLVLGEVSENGTVLLRKELLVRGRQKVYQVRDPSGKTMLVVRPLLSHESASVENRSCSSAPPCHSAPPVLLAQPRPSIAPLAAGPQAPRLLMMVAPRPARTEPAAAARHVTSSQPGQGGGGDCGCQLRPLVVCQHCGAYCHDDCLLSGATCSSCLACR